MLKTINNTNNNNYYYYYYVNDLLGWLKPESLEFVLLKIED